MDATGASPLLLPDLTNGAIPGERFFITYRNNTITDSALKSTYTQKKYTHFYFSLASIHSQFEFIDASQSLSGSWGALPGPTLIRATASDPDDNDAVFSAQDSIIMVFSRPTNKPPVQNQSDISEFLHCDFFRGKDPTFSGLWSPDGTELNITVIQTPADITPILAVTCFFFSIF